MLTNQTPNRNLTEKSMFSCTLSVWKCQAQEDTPTNFQLISYSDALVFKAARQFQHQIRQNGLRGGKKRQQMTTLAAAGTTVYERKIDAGDVF